MLYIGKTYTKMGNEAEAKRWLTDALKKKSDGTYDDDKAANEARALLDLL
jgi:hypothetical protein